MFHLGLYLIGIVNQYHLVHRIGGGLKGRYLNHLGLKLLGIRSQGYF